VAVVQGDLVYITGHLQAISMLITPFTCRTSLDLVPRDIGSTLVYMFSAEMVDIGLKTKIKIKAIRAMVAFNER